MLFDIGVKSCYWENLEIYKICFSNATKGKFAILFSNRQRKKQTEVVKKRPPHDGQYGQYN